MRNVYQGNGQQGQANKQTKQLDEQLWGGLTLADLKMWGVGRQDAGHTVPCLLGLTEKEILASFKNSFVWSKQEVVLLKGTGSIKLDLAIENWLAAKEQEELRLQGLSAYEAELWQGATLLVAGVDEVGRGPIAGPVVAAAVILPPNFKLYGVDDSKKLSEAKRLKLEKIIKANAVAWAIGAIGVSEIDRYNILQASKMAMAKAIGLLPMAPEHVLIDAVHLEQLSIPQTAIIKGDAKSISIGAASILAKCHRDRIMKVYAKLYPQYGFQKHMGYPTPQHKEVVFREGYSKIHRRTFVLKPIKKPQEKCK